MTRILLGCVLLCVSFVSSRADVSISARKSKNITCIGGVCSPTAKGANLSIKDLTKLLANDDVTVKTAGEALAISVQNDFAWSSAHRLTLDAAYNIGIRAQIIVEGGGALTIKTADGVTGGDLLFFDTGNIAFWDTASNLVINGKTFTLINDLATLSENVDSDPFGNYALAQHYNAAKYGSVAIRAAFDGTFEGLGHTIAGYNLQNTSDCLGLFDNVNSSALVRDLRMVDAAVTAEKSKAASVGLVVGCNSGTVQGVTANGNVSGGIGSAVGGIIGLNNGTVKALSANVEVTGQYYSGIGGVVGTNYGAIVNSFASGQITGVSYLEKGEAVGGVAGRNYGSILGSAASANVDGGRWGWVGGLAGYGTGSISLSHASGTVSTGVLGSAGGLAGSSGPIDQSWATGNVTGSYGKRNKPAHYGGLVAIGGPVTNSYATGELTGATKNDVGGLAGDSAGISTSYSIGRVNGGTQKGVGGLTGASYQGSYTSAYWDIDTSGQTSGCGSGACTGVTGLSDAQLKAVLPGGFDPGIWAQNAAINDGYPYLIANPPQ